MQYDCVLIKSRNLDTKTDMHRGRTEGHRENALQRWRRRCGGLKAKKCQRLPLNHPKWGQRCEQIHLYSPPKEPVLWKPWSLASTTIRQYISVQFGVPIYGSPRKRIYSVADGFHHEPPLGSWMIKVCQMFLALITSIPEGNRGCFLPILHCPIGARLLQHAVAVKLNAFSMLEMETSPECYNWWP